MNGWDESVALSPAQARGLRRVAQRGLRNAGYGLSELVGRPVEVAVPRVDVAPLPAVIERVGGPETLIVAVYLEFQGDLGGHLLLALPVPAALALAEALLDRAVGGLDELDELALSALCETGNVTGSFFLNALAEDCRYQLLPSPPAIGLDMAGALLDAVLAEIARGHDRALVLETSFRASGAPIAAHFLAVPDPGSLSKLLDRLAETAVAP